MFLYSIHVHISYVTKIRHKNSLSNGTLHRRFMYNADIQHLAFLYFF